MIAVTLTNPRNYKLANASDTDYIEIRTDLYPKTNINVLLAQCTKPVILTMKSPQKMLLDYIDVLQVKYVDIDYRLIGLIREFHTIRPKSVKLIVSFHDFKETPSWSQLQTRLRQLRKLKPDVIKIATLVNQFDDLYTITRLQQVLGKQGIVIGMGELGIMTRVYNKTLLTYARLQGKQAAAPGQLTVQELRSMKIYGLVGWPIDRSLSPLMHNTAFAQYKLPYRYQLWETHDIKKFITVFNFFKLPGASVTMPYKEAIMKYVDIIDSHAKAIGAVNTLVRRGSQVFGYNTDWLGAKAALQAYVKRKQVCILGSGGAAGGVHYAMHKAGAANIRLIKRKDMPTNEDDFDVLINATPVYDTLLVPEDSLYGKVVMDCNYGIQTELLRQAKGKAHIVMDGLPMLLHQGAVQFKLWTGKSLPISEVEKAIARYRTKQKHLIF